MPGICLLAILGLGFGLFTAGAVFTTVIVVGLVPRFAGRFHTANKVFLYEEWVIAGSLLGGLYGVFHQNWQVAGWDERNAVLQVLSVTAVVIWALFTGMFVGCLAIAIEELLGGIPIFARRVHLRKGLGVLILAIACGKTCGSLFYFFHRLFP